MATRAVRLGEEGEAALADLRDRTGLSISEVIRQALRTYSAELDRETAARPCDIYRNIALPPSGGYAPAPSSRAKAAVAIAMRRRHATCFGACRVKRGHRRVAFALMELSA